MLEKIMRLLRRFCLHGDCNHVGTVLHAQIEWAWIKGDN